MPRARIWTSTDPWLTKRLENSVLISRGDLAITNAAMSAMNIWLNKAKAAIYHRPYKGPHLPAPPAPDHLTADTGDANSDNGAIPPDALPDMSAWPAATTWQLTIDQVVTPQITKLFGLAFAKATREADIQDRHYTQAYTQLVSNRLSTNLWPHVVFDDVRDVISEGIAKGWSINRITNELSGTLSTDKWAYEARRIARTETMGAVNAGQWNGTSAYAEATGDEMFKQWYATSDSRTRPDHVRAHHQVVPIAATYTVGGWPMSYPGDPAGPASEVCNCRCTSLYLTADEAREWIDPDAWSGPDEVLGPVTASTASTFPPDLEPSVSTATLAGARPATAAPPALSQPNQAAADGDVGTWYGVLAPLDTPSADGRMIAMPSMIGANGDDNAGTAGAPEPRTRPLPIPLLYQDALSAGHDGAVPVGLITDAWIEAGNLMGCGTFDLGDPRAAEIARKVASGNLGWVSVDLDDTSMELEIGADDSGAEDMLVARDWRLMSATLVSQPAFPQAKISTGRPGDADPGDTHTDDTGIGTAAATAHREAVAAGVVHCDDTECEYCGQSEEQATMATGGKMPGEDPHNPHAGAAGPAAPIERTARSANPAMPTRPRKALKSLPAPKYPVPKPADFAAQVTEHQLPASFKVLGPDLSLPVAGAGATWNGGAAAKRIADWAKDSDGNLDPGKFGDAFLYRDDDADPTNSTGYKLGYADLIGGKLTIIPKAVYAIAAAIGGARSPLDVPDGQMDPLKSAVEKLYARLADALGDKNIKAPWQDDEASSKSAAVTRRASVSFRVGAEHESFAPPLAWFQNPSFPSYMNVTICDDGRIFGHLAPWNECHTGRSDRCYTAPKSPSGYAYFHQGTVRTAEGLDVAVGTIHMGTDHASTRGGVSAADAQRHYADTGMASAVVRAGEDAFGIWIAGAVLPGADLVTLRRAPWSGDWRRIGPAMELCGVLCVNQPGFPIPRPAWKTDDRGVVCALTAAAGTDYAKPDVPSGAEVMEQFTANIAESLATRMRAEMAAERARARRFDAAAAKVNQMARGVRNERMNRAMAAIKKEV